jgi:hypothetical protein
MISSGAAGNTRADPRDEYHQSTLGSATNSWRASQARHRNRTDQRGQVYGQAEGPAIPVPIGNLIRLATEAELRNASAL